MCLYPPGSIAGCPAIGDNISEKCDNTSVNGAIRVLLRIVSTLCKFLTWKIIFLIKKQETSSKENYFSYKEKGNF